MMSQPTHACAWFCCTPSHFVFHFSRFHQSVFPFFETLLLFPSHNSVLFFCPAKICFFFSLDLYFPLPSYPPPRPCASILTGWRLFIYFPPLFPCRMSLLLTPTACLPNSFFLPGPNALRVLVSHSLFLFLETLHYTKSQQFPFPQMIIKTSDRLCCIPPILPQRDGRFCAPSQEEKYTPLSKSQELFSFFRLVEYVFRGAFCSAAAVLDPAASTMSGAVRFLSVPGPVSFRFFFFLFGPFCSVVFPSCFRFSVFAQSHPSRPSSPPTGVLSYSISSRFLRLFVFFCCF